MARTKQTARKATSSHSTRKLLILGPRAVLGTTPLCSLQAANPLAHSSQPPGPGPDPQVVDATSELDSEHDAVSSTDLKKLFSQ
jgi:hypothetical protein